MFRKSAGVDANAAGYGASLPVATRCMMQCAPSHIEPDVENVAIANDILFTLDAHQPFLTSRVFGTALHKVLVRDDFRLDEASLHV